MLEILAQRILKSSLLAIDNLCPLPRSGVSKNPTRVVFGLDHEYSVSGYDNVVDLGWSSRRGKRDIVKDFVFSRRQLTVENRIDSTFTARTFD
jgi:hypothetical protein